MNEIRQQIETFGYAIVPQCVRKDTIEELARVLDASQHGMRNLLTDATVRTFARSDEVRRPVVFVLGSGCFAVRGIFFNKNARTNWKVAWHQDSVIAVRQKVAIEGWGPWSCKAGVVHVRPTAHIMQSMLAIRIHLDECGENNGPLRVIPGSHLQGILSDEQVQNWPKESAVTCAVHRGEAILMRPLLLHASSPAAQPSNRRVLHLEFAANELPSGAEWHDRVC